MVKTPQLNLPTSPPQYKVLNQDTFNRGVISLIDESKLPRNALKTADNWWLSEDGSPSIRPGINWYGNTVPNGLALEGGAFFTTQAGVSHLVVSAGGVIYRSLDSGTTWEQCTGATFTTGYEVQTEQANNFLYLVNGQDNIIRYDGTTTLVTYTSLSTPVGNTPTKTGLAGTQIYTYRYRVSAVNDIGNSIASAATTITTDRTRDQFDDTNFVTFTWGAVTGAKFYDIYTGQTAGEECFVARIEGQASTTYLDKLNAPEQLQLVAPDTNTTQGPKLGDIALVGTRLYGTRDKDNPWRVWISGSGRFIGQFGVGGYESTYVDLQKGSQFRPVKVYDYRDGKGTPLATVWCDSADGRGAIFQGTLDTLTVGTLSIPVPNFYKLPGSRGTNAPFSVVNVLNDFMYFNSQAIYNLGSRADFLNLLSTDESSANIRPNVREINQAASKNVASYFFESKVYFSVPYNSTTNNATLIYDTERKAYLPKAFTVGFKRFFQYTDASGGRHLLCWKPGDSRISEISQNIKGDYGIPFQTNLVTGLNHVNPKNRFEFMWAVEGEVEFAQPQGMISIELSAITRESGYKPIATRNIIPTTSSNQWTTGRWTTHKWTYIPTASSVFAETSVKRYFRLQKDINAYQYRISTNDLDAACILRTLQINGTDTQGGKPRIWLLNT